MAEFDLFNVGDQRSGQVDPHHLSEREVQVNYRLLKEDPEHLNQARINR